MTNDKKPHLVLVKGGTSAASADAALRLPEKLARLGGLTAKRKMDYILSDPAGRDIVRALPPTDLYWTVQELGLSDALPLVELASPEQLQHFFDIEWWDRWEFLPEKGVEWLRALLECGESVINELLPQLDPELLLIFLKHEILVGGGIGDMIGDEEKALEWDHTFDEMFMITFRNKDNAEAVGTFLDIVYRNNHALYVYLMEGGKGDISAEVEELAYQFRTGRLADLGFPAPEEAAEIYAPISPAAFIPSGDKEATDAVFATLPTLVEAGAGTLLQRLLPQAPEQVRVELNYLINNALVLEKWQEVGPEGARRVFDRVNGWLNLALESLAEGNEEKAASLLEGEYLKRLFRVGGGILRELARKAQGFQATSPAAERLLDGLAAAVPRYYRGLDAEGMDGYREFASMSDVRRVESFLEKLISK